MFDSMEKYFGLEKVDVGTYSPLTLAYIGDCVYELVIRTKLVHRNNAPVNLLNREGSYYAKAATQAFIIEALYEELSEEEAAAYRRGRNAHSATKAKNASMSDYRKATGFEALIGYLYVQRNFDRLMELIARGFELLNEKKEKK